jgi:hypothetical protein
MAKTGYFAAMVRVETKRAVRRVSAAGLAALIVAVALG